MRVQGAIGVLAFIVVVGLTGWLNDAYLRETWRWFTLVRPYVATQVKPFVLNADAERVLRPLTSFRECATHCPEMVAIPAGEFNMGSPPEEKHRNDDEGPQHKVVISKLFAVSKFEVTFDDWGACVVYGNCDAHISDATWGRGRRPVINVTWDDAKRYVAWLSSITGKTYRLLSEAEWEYAARAGVKTSTVEDASNLGRYAWYSGNAGKKTHEVGQKQPNAFNLYDMYGNVWEWVEDCEIPYLDGERDASPRTTGDCSHRIARGGSWFHEAANLRSAYRLRHAPDVRTRDVGFRVARMVDLHTVAEAAAPASLNDDPGARGDDARPSAIGDIKPIVEAAEWHRAPPKGRCEPPIGRPDPARWRWWEVVRLWQSPKLGCGSAIDCCAPTRAQARQHQP